MTRYLCEILELKNITSILKCYVWDNIFVPRKAITHLCTYMQLDQIITHMLPTVYYLQINVKEFYVIRNIYR